MKAACPLAVYSYIRSVLHNTDSFTYLKLNSRYCVVDLGGDLEVFGLDRLNNAIPFDQQFIPLIGLLPVVGDPVVLMSINIANNRYVDIHIIPDDPYLWIALIDRTRQERVRQEEQQRLLDGDLFSEKLNTA